MENNKTTPKKETSVAKEKKVAAVKETVAKEPKATVAKESKTVAKEPKVAVAKEPKAAVAKETVAKETPVKPTLAKEAKSFEAKDPKNHTNTPNQQATTRVVTRTNTNQNRPHNSQNGQNSQGLRPQFRKPFDKNAPASANGKTGQKRPPRRDNNRPRREDAFPDFSEKVVDIARVTKVVKGGRRFSFSAFVVVGNKKGRVGFGHGKANEVPDAIKKAIKDAQNNLIDVPVLKGTVPHEIQAKFLASKVMLKPAPKGKGLIASGTVRAVVELAGYTDIVTKTYGSRSKSNTVKAAVKALKLLRTPDQIAAIRDKDVKELL